MVCVSCGKTFKSNKVNAKYCSDKCRNKMWGKYQPVNSSLSSGTQGALSELRVCADLLQKGYSVFRSVSPSCSCDLAILKDGKLLMVEVKTGSRHKDGRVFHPQVRETNHFDVLAVALHDGEIIYQGLAEKCQ